MKIQFTFTDEQNQFLCDLIDSFEDVYGVTQDRLVVQLIKKIEGKPRAALYKGQAYLIGILDTLNALHADRLDELTSYAVEKLEHEDVI